MGMLVHVEYFGGKIYADVPEGEVSIKGAETAEEGEYRRIEGAEVKVGNLYLYGKFRVKRDRNILIIKSV